jgi:hypothetical protein
LVSLSNAASADAAATRCVARGRLPPNGHRGVGKRGGLATIRDGDRIMLVDEHGIE